MHMEQESSDDLSVNEMYQEFGKFMILYSGIEYFITTMLSAASDTRTDASHIILQGLTLTAKIRKLKGILLKKVDNSEEVIEFLKRYSDAMRFRDKIVHWTPFIDPDRSTFSFRDQGRDPSQIFKVLLKVSTGDLRSVNAYMGQAHTALFSLTLGFAIGEKFVMESPKTLLPQGPPPLPSM